MSGVTYLEQLEWIPVVDYPEYEICKYGILRDAETLEAIPQFMSGKYLAVRLKKNATQKGKNINVHKLTALHFVINPTPETRNVVDHADGNRFNNWASNLRFVTRGENRINSKQNANSTSGVTGVRFHKHSGKWESSIRINGKRKNTYFDTKEDAITHRKEMERLYYGEFVPTRDIVITVKTTSTNPKCPTGNKNDDSSVITDSTES